MKIVKQFQLNITIFTAVKNRCILHGRVLVMGVFVLHGLLWVSVVNIFVN